MSNPHYQAPDQSSIPPAPNGGKAVPNPHYTSPSPAPAPPTTPPPGGGTPLPNPNYVAPLRSDDDSIPAFIRNSVNVNDVKQVVKTPGNDDKGVTAEVNDATPNQIDVFDPGKYDTGRRNHELTHVYQDSRGDSTSSTSAVTGEVSIHNDPYDYSGRATSSRALPKAEQMKAKLEGLQKARNDGKTIANFNDEQQAEIVRDYKDQHDSFLKKVKDGTATKKDLQAMSDLQNTYHPFIDQLAKMPSKTSSHTSMLDTLLGHNMPTINTRPDAPGLPSFATPGIGIVAADPLMGGHSQPIRSNKKSKQ